MKKITNSLSDSAKKSMLTRIITGIVLAVVCVPCLVLGDWFFTGLSIVVTIFAAVEIVKATNLKGLIRILIYFLTTVFMLALTYYCMYKNNITPSSVIGPNLLSRPEFLINSFSEISLSVMLITFIAAVYFLISFASEPFNVAYVFYFFTMIVVVAIGIKSLLFLRYSPFKFFEEVLPITEKSKLTTSEFKYGQSIFLLIYVVLGTIANDIGAYFVGILFGKHKMNERISPKKTWEGFIGGVVFSIVFSTTFALVVAAVKMPMLPMFDLAHLYYVIIISILMPLFADVGDFVFSSIKRTFGVKDFSQLLPGHGGILDRIDSLLFVAALVGGLVTFINLINQNGVKF